MTPVTPILIPAPTVESLRDEGFEVKTFLAEISEFPIDQDSEEEKFLKLWEPPRPDGEGWVLHAKHMVEDGDLCAIWARPRSKGDADVG